MILRCALTAVVVLSVGFPASAQTDFQSRVRNLIDNMPATSDVLNDENHRSTLDPFYGLKTPESELDPEDFDEEEVLRQGGDGMVARAFGNQKDSALSRPDMGLSRDDLSLADGAIETSDDTLGGMFTGSVGSCETDFEGGYTVGEQFCRRNLSATTESCQQRRVASVDRDDRWECLVDTPTYKKVCGGVISYSCSGSTGASCLSNAVSVVGGGASIYRSGGRTYLELPRVGDNCTVGTTNVTLRISPNADITGLRLGKYNQASVMQVRSGSTYLHTSSYFTNETDGSPLPRPEVRRFNVSSPLAAYSGSGLACILSNVAAGSTIVGTTANYSGLAARNLNVNLTSRVAAASRTASIRSNGTVNVNLGATRTIPLSFTYAGSWSFMNVENRVELLLSGSCCSNVSAQADMQCN